MMAQIIKKNMENILNCVEKHGRKGRKIDIVEKKYIKNE